MTRVGVIGYGYWGPNLVRNFAENPNAVLASVCDASPQRLALAQRRYPGVRVTTSAKELIEDPAIDAVAIATPVQSHCELGLRAMAAGKHVLMAKPLAASVTEAEALVEEAARRRVVLMVDHTFLYTGAVRKIKQLLDTGELGACRYYDSVRVNLGLFQPDVNVVWDLAVHDLSIMDYLLGAQPCAISATGIGHLPGCSQSIAYMTCFFQDRMIAHIHVNWLAPVKIRRTLLGGSRKMVVYDDVEPSEKVKVYDKGVIVSDNPDNVYQKMIEYRMGDMFAPHLDMREALAVEIDEFLRCAETGARPLSDGDAGLRVVRLLAAATESMRQQGHPVEIENRSGGDDSLRRLASAVSDDPGRGAERPQPGLAHGPVHSR